MIEPAREASFPAVSSPEDGGPPDTELVRRAQGGDTSAFEILVRRHQARIRGMLYHMTGHREDAEDLTQAAFLRAYRALRRFQGQSSFYTWLYRIAVNLALNFIKKRKRQTGAGTLSLDDIDTAAERDSDYVELAGRDTPDRNAHLAEIQRRIHSALGTLTEKHRAVVVMHDLQGMPHDEVARVLRVPTATVRTRLFYARRQLQQELRELVEN
ncbi:MAG: sigma-70 family RNA polymerase sigma factor [Kiritimatiellae bacterium]|nr:sigma-70 family RNA polymerase sigma factor [Kiritimatiellia bacterium]